MKFKMVEQRLLPALFLLTLVTGIVDAVTFLGLGHVFAGNATGNVLFLGFALAGVPGISIAHSLISTGAFLAGSVLGGRLGVAMASTPHRWLCIATVFESILLFLAALTAIGLEIGSTPPFSQPCAVILLTAVAMGFRNATVRRLAVPDITTTVLTLTISGIASDSSLASGTNLRMGRRIASVCLMFCGASVGILLVRHGLAFPLALCGVCTLAAAFMFSKAKIT